MFVGLRAEAIAQLVVHPVHSPHGYPALNQLEHLAQARRERLAEVGVAPDHQRFRGEVQTSTVRPLDGRWQRVVQRIVLADETQDPGVCQAAHVLSVDRAAQNDRHGLRPLRADLRHRLVDAHPGQGIVQDDHVGVLPAQIEIQRPDIGETGQVREVGCDGQQLLNAKPDQIMIIDDSHLNVHRALLSVNPDNGLARADAAPHRLIFALLCLIVWVPIQSLVNARYTKISIHVAVVTGIAAALVAMGDLDTPPLVGGAVAMIAAVAWARVVTGNHTRLQIALGILVSVASVVIAYGVMSLWRPL